MYRRMLTTADSWWLISGACGMILIILPLLLLASGNLSLHPKFTDRKYFMIHRYTYNMRQLLLNNIIKLLFFPIPSYFSIIREYSSEFEYTVCTKF